VKVYKVGPNNLHGDIVYIVFRTNNINESWIILTRLGIRINMYVNKILHVGSCSLNNKQTIC